MRFFNKYFFSGLASGVLLTILIVPLATHLAIRMWLDPSAFLPLPPFSDSYYGPMDYGWSVRTLDGTQISLSDFRGKPIYLNFWATWCAPCIAEMPSIQNLYDVLKNEEVVFLVVSDETAETVRAFMEERQFTLPAYLSMGDLPEALRSKALPTTFIIDSGGNVVFKHTGAAQWDDDSSVDFLRSLM